VIAAELRQELDKTDFFRYCWCFEQNIAGIPESGDMTGALPPCSFIRGASGRRCLLKSIKGKFMAYQDRLVTNLLQLFPQPETSK